MSLDKKRLAPVDMTDEDVVLIWNRETRKIEYIHPTTERGMKIMGVTKEMMEKEMDLYEKD